MNTIQVMLVDDHAVLRTGLRTLLSDQDDIEVVGEADNGDDALELFPNIQPDIVVMDLGMPGSSAFEVIRTMRQIRPDAGVIVLSMHKGTGIVSKALESGADGYVPKSSAHTDLLRAIRTVHGGRAYLHPTATTVLVEAIRSSGSAQVLLSNLSDREREVMRWTARGYSSREIGDMLSISGKTVDTYRSRLMQKLDLQHRSELVELALKAGMLEETNIDE